HTTILTLSLHDALPISFCGRTCRSSRRCRTSAHHPPLDPHHAQHPCAQVDQRQGVLVVAKALVGTVHDLLELRDAQVELRRDVRSEEDTSELQSRSDLV